MTKLVSMKRDPEEIKESNDVMASPTQDAYPYGLRLCLCEEEMEKLGITELPKIGAEMGLVAKVKVVRVSSNASEGQEDESKSLEFQVTEMCIESGGKSAAASLYGENDDAGE